MPSGSAGLRRLVSLLLLAVFLGAGTTLPGPDTLLYHWGEAGAEQPRTHIESAGGCGSHVEHCTLGRTAAGAEAYFTTELVVHVRAADVFDEPALRSGAPLPRYTHTLPQPRAPPVPVA